VENAKTLLDAYAGGIYLYDPVKNELEVKVATDSSIPLGLRLAMGEGLAGQVAQTRQAMAVDDYQTWPFRSQKYENVRVRATAEVPLIYNAELIGVLVVHEFGESTRQFTQADLQLLSLFAAQSAGAIYNVRLLEAERHRRIEAETLREAASTLAASFDLHQILETLLAFLRRVVDYDSACVFLLEGKVIRAMAASGHPAPEKILGQSFPLDNDQLMPEIYQTGTPLILQDAQQDPRFLGWGGTEYIRGWMGIPLWARGQIIGILTVDSRQPGAYSPGEAALAQAFANQAAIALDNMQLLEAERRRRTEAETLYEATSALSVPLELSLVLENLLAALQRVVPYDSACVFFREGDFVRAMAAAGLPVPELVVNQRFPLANNYLQPDIYQTGQPIILEDAQLTDYFLKWGRTDYVRGWMGIPLWARGQIIGVLTVDSRQPGAYTPTEAALAQAFANQAGIAIDNARLLETERRRSEEADTLRQVMMAFIETFDLQEVLDQILTHLHRVIAYDQAHIGLLEGQHLRVVAQHGFRFPEQAKVHLSIDQFPHLQEAISQRIPVIISDTYTDPRWLSFPGVEHIRCWMGVPLIVKDRVIGLLNFDKTEAGSYTREHALLATTFAGQAAVAIENARLFEETIQRQSELEAVNRISKALRITSNMEAMFPILLQESSAILGVEAGVIWLYDPLSQKLHRKAASGWFAEIEEPEIQPGEGIAGQVFLSGESYQSQEFLTDPHTRALARSQVPDGWGGICVPLRAGQEVVGVFFISVPTTRQLTDQEVHLLHTVAEIAGSAMHRAQLHTMMQNQLQRLLALRSIDAAISASLDLRLILDLLLEHILSELHLDAACVLLATPQTYTLHFAAGRGFLTTAFQQVIIHFGEGLAGRVAADQAPLTVPDLRNLELYARSKMAQQEGFVFYTGVPLIAKGQVQGVLEVYQRSAFYAPPDWLDFLDALAAQAAIAINSAQLFADLQRSNTELMLAYDSTLEGWIGMLDMRDKETEGHTLRVMEMTVRLAQKLDLKDEQLIQLRRGALLHDIGKLAIPDRILLKTGPLNPDEWDAMRMHPQHAFNMLSRIPFLRPALDIPYCHHEKWDGTGYPRGLKGEQIPLAARIFSVVDVWDALTNDRPYRKAWPQDQARTYLLEQCGKYFDPKIPPVFLTLLDES
jgi:GAF domain-containing protein